MYLTKTSRDDRLTLQYDQDTIISVNNTVVMNFN